MTRNQRRQVKRSLRPCGGCTACCTDLVVRLGSVVKDAGKACPRATSRGCGAYVTRPAECVSYHCAWRCRLWGLEDQHRPDRWGVLVDSCDGTVAVRVLRDNAMQSLPAGMVRDMRRTGVKRVLVMGQDGEVIGELT
jgi:hypothetical protein